MVMGVRATARAMRKQSGDVKNLPVGMLGVSMIFAGPVRSAIGVFFQMSPKAGENTCRSIR